MPRLPEQVSIAGHAASDPDVEITFDVFAPGDESLQVGAENEKWMADADAIEATVEGTTVSGTASVQRLIGGETGEATFEFTCP